MHWLNFRWSKCWLVWWQSLRHCGFLTEDCWSITALPLFINRSHSWTYGTWCSPRPASIWIGKLCNFFHVKYFEIRSYNFWGTYFRCVFDARTFPINHFPFFSTRKAAPMCFCHDGVLIWENVGNSKRFFSSFFK